MNKEMLLECRLYPLSEDELLVGGGASWQEDVKRFFFYVKIIIDFINEYKEDMYRGFERGWKTF